MRATAAEVEERRRHRRKQLAHMVAYAEANTWDRRVEVLEAEFRALHARHTADPGGRAQPAART